MNIQDLSVSQLVELQTSVRSTLKHKHKWYSTVRPSWDEYFSQMVLVVAQRANCCRRQVGAVLVDKDNNTLATGYNGKAAGLTNCLDCPCSAGESTSGNELRGCEAIHAEVNALIRCADVRQIHTAYVSCSPCIECVNVLLGTGCVRIVFTEKYKDHQESSRRWLASNRQWVHLTPEPV